MKKVFLDCGGNDGCSVRKFRDLHDKNNNYIIHSFEPNPIFKKCYSYFINHTFHEVATWIYDGNIKLYLDYIDGDGSSLIQEKKILFDSPSQIQEKKSTNIKCIDLSKWILDNFVSTDRIILKLDIEGAEYDVLKKMILDGSINYIDELFIEWHWDKIGKSKKEHDLFISSMNNVIINSSWDAGDFKYRSQLVWKLYLKKEKLFSKKYLITLKDYLICNIKNFCLVLFL